MKPLLLFLFLASFHMGNAQFTLTITKKRPPVMDISAYKQVAVGDIVGPSGVKNESSLDLTDELTAKLFNSKTYEIIDRNALSDILASNKKGTITTINETTTAALSKKLNSALLIIGRLQNEVITQNQNSANNGTTPCGKDYWWEAKYDLTVQLKIIEVKTGNMLYSKPITYTKMVQSTRSCTITEKFPRETLAMQSIPKLAEEIIKVVIPYEEEINLYFDRPALAMLKNPLKKTESAIVYLRSGEFEKGLEILKAYAEDKSIKGSTSGKAAYNYGLALYANSQYDAAKTQFTNAIGLGLVNPLCSRMLDQIEQDKEYDRKLARMKMSL